jgi:hypothetical protein
MIYQYVLPVLKFAAGICRAKLNHKTHSSPHPTKKIGNDLLPKYIKMPLSK